MVHCQSTWLTWGAAPPVPETAGAMHDTVIRGGLVVDGSGGEPVLADIAIDGDTITAVGTVSGTGAWRSLSLGRTATAAPPPT